MSAAVPLHEDAKRLLVKLFRAGEPAYRDEDEDIYAGSVVQSLCPLPGNGEGRATTFRWWMAYAELWESGALEPAGGNKFRVSQRGLYFIGHLAEAGLGA